MSSTKLATETTVESGQPAAAATATVDEDEVMTMKVDDVPGSLLHGACQHYVYHD
jgi:hypothetical protein